MAAIPKMRPVCVMKRSPLFCWLDVSNMCLAVLESERACKLVNTRCVSVVTAAARRTRSQMRMHGGTRAVGEQWGFTEARSRRRSGRRHPVQEALGEPGQAQ